MKHPRSSEAPLQLYEVEVSYATRVRVDIDEWNTKDFMEHWNVVAPNTEAGKLMAEALAHTEFCSRGHTVTKTKARRKADVHALISVRT